MVSGDRLSMWDARSGKLVSEISCGGGPAQQLAWSPDGDEIAVAVGGAIDFISTRTLTKRHAIALDGEARPQFGFGGTGSKFFVATGDGIDAYSYPDMALQNGGAPSHSGTITSLAFDVAGTRFATGGEDACCILWTQGSLTPTACFAKFDHPVSCVAFDRSSRYLALGIRGDKQITVINVAYRTPIQVATRGEHTPNALAWSPTADVLCWVGDTQKEGKKHAVISLMRIPHHKA